MRPSRLFFRRALGSRRGSPSRNGSGPPARSIEEIKAPVIDWNWESILVRTTQAAELRFT
jgi:hypothetical protein